MRYQRDVGLLILYSFLALFFIDVDVLFVLAFLSAVIIGCLNYFIDSRTYILAATLIDLLIAVFVPAFLFFIPVIIYIWVRNKLYIPVGCAAAVLLYYSLVRGSVPLLLFLICCFGIVLSVMLAIETESYEKLEDEFRRTRDDSMERNFLLAEKNKVLLENQDYEIYTATLQERNRIAREIHDNVGHMLSRSILMVGALQATVSETAAKESIQALGETLNSAMDSIRNSVHDLHDEAVNLEEAVRGLVNEFTFCEAEFDYDMGRDVPKDIKYSFISITKEALANIIKHSSATKVHIIMREHPALYQFCIDDNGKYIQIEESGIGLVNMKDRIGALKGNIRISTEKGFRIFITIPKEM